MSLWNMPFTPMLLKEIAKPFNSKDYLFELKYDGEKYNLKFAVRLINEAINQFIVQKSEQKKLMTQSGALVNNTNTGRTFGSSISNKDISQTYINVNPHIPIKYSIQKNENNSKELDNSFFSMFADAEPKKHHETKLFDLQVKKDKLKTCLLIIDNIKVNVNLFIFDKLNGKEIKKTKVKTRKQVSDLTKALELSLKDLK